MQTLGNIMKFESKDERIFMSIELSNTLIPPAKINII